MSIMRALNQLLSPVDQLTGFENMALRRLPSASEREAARRFLFIIADSGGGHRTTANAVKAQLLQQVPDACVYLMPAVDILNHPQRLFSRGIEEAYNKAIQWGAYWMEPMLFNSVYMMELPVIHQYIALRNAQIIDAFQPEAVVAFVPATQELTYHALQFLRKADTVPLYTVITDLVSMRHNWIMPEQAYSFVPTPEARDYFLGQGIPAEKMEVTGLPVHPRFTSPDAQHRSELQQKYGLDPARFTLLMVMGANGSQSIYRYCQQIERLRLPIQIIACCGHSQRLRQQVSALAARSQTPIHALGFTRDMPELMQVADLLLTKPGSVSIAESLSQNLPLLIDASNFIMWQERGNDQYIEQHGLGFAFRSRQGLLARLSQLVQSPADYRALKQRLVDFPKPQAAARITEVLLHGVQGNPS